jgi:hypothetical protein
MTIPVLYKAQAIALFANSYIFKHCILMIKHPSDDRFDCFPVILFKNESLHQKPRADGSISQG